VWLVHKPPSGIDEAQRLTFTFGRTATEFSFPPVEVTKDGEKATVDVSGFLRIVPAVAGQDKLMVSLTRAFRKKNSGTGGSVKQLEIPEPNEVLSFELPVMTSRSDPSLASHLEGHQFSVRLRVTPR
jgi:hypothetical protein